MKLTVLAALLTLGSLAHAQKPAELPQCTSIVQQCEKAGYEPGEHKKNGKGLWVDCVGAIAHGKSVAGVTASEADAKACAQAARAERKEKKEEKKK